MLVSDTLLLNNLLQWVEASIWEDDQRGGL